MEFGMVHTCPVCGYENLTKDPTYLGSFEICPSCFFQFGYDDRDRGFTFEQWRRKWIDGGMVWRNGREQPPPGWDPRRQLLNIGIQL
jgi:hypothetical protein